MTETILHGYQVVLLPRSTGAHEVVVTAPGAGDKRYDEHRMKWRIRQLEQELQAMQTAQALLVANIRPSVAVSAGGGVPGPLEQHNDLRIE
jgi:predicted RNA-binding protein with PUA domain